MFNDNVLFETIGVGIILAIILGVVSCQASMEARTWNKLTQVEERGLEPATWWDALWVSLRVDCN